MPMDKAPCVYMMASGRNGTLYVGATSNLLQRVAQHKNGTFDGFSRRYGTKFLVWLEYHPTMESAFMREKILKKYQRLWKIRLIEEMNPAWADLSEPYFTV